MNQVLEFAKKRRTRYGLTDKILLSEMDLLDIISQSVKYTPSPFNCQGGRIVVLLGEKSRLFWNIVLEKLRSVVPESHFPATKEKIESFASGYGTILFYEDMSAVEELQQKFPAYKDNFLLWAYQSNAMLEFLVWTALAEEGIGASLQHYNPLVDTEIQTTFGIPSNWKLLAQMPFGIPFSEPEEKTFLPLSERIKVFK